MGTTNETTTGRTLTNAELEQAHGAFKVLAGIVAALGDGKGAPEYDTAKGVEDLLVRTVFAVQEKEAEASRQIMITAKRGVDGVCHAARLATIEAYREIANLTPAVRKLIGKAAEPPIGTSVPVSEVAQFFPEDWNQEQVIACLHKMNYKLVVGASRDSVKKLRVNIGSEALARVLAAKPGETEVSTTE